jgi:3-phenylpropionate/cinnamic acid dioxygenase small subunit
MKKKTGKTEKKTEKKYEKKKQDKATEKESETPNDKQNIIGTPTTPAGLWKSFPGDQDSEHTAIIGVILQALKEDPHQILRDLTLRQNIKMKALALQTNASDSSQVTELARRTLKIDEFQRTAEHGLRYSNHLLTVLLDIEGTIDDQYDANNNDNTSDDSETIINDATSLLTSTQETDKSSKVEELEEHDDNDDYDGTDPPEPRTLEPDEDISPDIIQATVNLDAIIASEKTQLKLQELETILNRSVLRIDEQNKSIRHLKDENATLTASLQQVRHKQKFDEEERDHFLENRMNDLMRLKRRELENDAMKTVKTEIANATPALLNIQLKKFEGLCNKMGQEQINRFTKGLSDRADKLRNQLKEKTDAIIGRLDTKSDEVDNTLIQTLDSARTLIHAEVQEEQKDLIEDFAQRLRETAKTIPPSEHSPATFDDIYDRLGKLDQSNQTRNDDNAKETDEIGIRLTALEQNGESDNKKLENIKNHTYMTVNRLEDRLARIESAKPDNDSDTSVDRRVTSSHRITRLEDRFSELRNTFSDFEHPPVIHVITKRLDRLEKEHQPDRHVTERLIRLENNILDISHPPDSHVIAQRLDRLEKEHLPDRHLTERLLRLENKILDISHPPDSHVIAQNHVNSDRLTRLENNILENTNMPDSHVITQRLDRLEHEQPPDTHLITQRLTRLEYKILEIMEAQLPQHAVTQRLTNMETLIGTRPTTLELQKMIDTGNQAQDDRIFTDLEAQIELGEDRLRRICNEFETSKKETDDTTNHV